MIKCIKHIKLTNVVITEDIYILSTGQVESVMIVACLTCKEFNFKGLLIPKLVIIDPSCDLELDNIPVHTLTIGSKWMVNRSLTLSPVTQILKMYFPAAELIAPSLHTYYVKTTGDLTDVPASVEHLGWIRKSSESKSLYLPNVKCLITNTLTADDVDFFPNIEEITYNAETVPDFILTFKKLQKQTLRTRFDPRSREFRNTSISCPIKTDIRFCETVIPPGFFDL